MRSDAHAAHEERPAAPQHDRRRERELQSRSAPPPSSVLQRLPRAASSGHRQRERAAASARSADPEAPRHVDELGVGLARPALTVRRLERHAADRAGARADRCTISGCIGQVYSRRVRTGAAAGVGAVPAQERARVRRELLAAARRCRSSRSCPACSTCRLASRGSTVMPQTGSRPRPAVVIRPARIEQRRSERKHAAVMSQFDCSGREQLREPPRTPSEDAKITLAVLASGSGVLGGQKADSPRCRKTT